jgi:hypothetical protein
VNAVFQVYSEPFHAAVSLRAPGRGVPVAECARCDEGIRADGRACLAGHPTASRSIALYATWTATRANLGAMHAHGVRLIAGPDQLDRSGIPPLAWALDNGAWGCRQRGVPFDSAAFLFALARWGLAADFIVLPDVVCGGLASLEMSLRWLPLVRMYGRPMLIPVQDGMRPSDLRAYVDADTGIFVGGSTDWKERSLRMWGQLRRETGCYLHVGRVNSARRIQLAIDAGAESCDGTSLSRYSTNADRLDKATRQLPRPDLFPEVA